MKTMKLVRNRDGSYNVDHVGLAYTNRGFAPDVFTRMVSAIRSHEALEDSTREEIQKDFATFTPDQRTRFAAGESFDDLVKENIRKGIITR